MIMFKKMLVLLVLAAICGSVFGASISVQIREGVYKEEVEGDLDGAMKIYEDIARAHSDNSRYAAQAMYRLGLCYLKKGEQNAAIGQFEGIVSKYPTEKSTVRKAKQQLKKLKPAGSGGSDRDQIIASSYVIHYKTIGTSDDGLAVFNRSHPARVKTHHANRYKSNGETISSICTDNATGKDKIVDMINSNPQLELVKVEEPKTAQSGKLVKLSHDSGEGVSKKSIAGSGHGVKFKCDSKGSVLEGISIFGSRYGEYNAPKENFKVWVCSRDYKPIKEFSFPYSKFSVRGESKWVNLKIDSIEVPLEFIICVGFNPQRTKGIYMYHDGKPSSNSLTGLPNAMKPFSEGNWLIRAVTASTNNSAAQSWGLKEYQILDNSFLDLDSGKIITEPKSLPREFDLSWDNDGGGVLMVSPKSSAKIVGLSDVMKGRHEDAIKSGKKWLELLRKSPSKAVLAQQTSFSAVLTDKGNLAIIEITEYSREKATIKVWMKDDGSNLKYGVVQYGNFTDEHIAKVVRKAVTVISTCSEGDPKVAAALKTLKVIEPKLVLEELNGHLDSQSATKRRSAVYIVWRGEFENIGPVVKKMFGLCSHDEGFTRGMAAITLGENKVNSSFDVLTKMTLNDKDGYARRCGAYALGRLGNEKALPILKKALNDADPMVKQNAEVAIVMLTELKDE